MPPGICICWLLPVPSSSSVSAFTASAPPTPPTRPQTRTPRRAMSTSYRSTRVRRPSSLSVSGPDRPLLQHTGRSNPHTTASGRPARSHLVYSRPAYSRPARSCSGHSPLAYSPAADSLPASAHSARTTPHAIPRRSSPASSRSARAPGTARSCRRPIPSRAVSGGSASSSPVPGSPFGISPTSRTIPAYSSVPPLSAAARSPSATAASFTAA